MEPNREALKLLSAINIDSNFVYQNGNQIFNYNSLSPEDFAAKCTAVRAAITDLTSELASLEALIPVQ